jgi:hypothetical protein
MIQKKENRIYFITKVKVHSTKTQKNNFAIASDSIRNWYIMIVTFWSLLLINGFKMVLINGIVNLSDSQ